LRSEKKDGTQTIGSKEQRKAGAVEASKGGGKRRWTVAGGRLGFDC